MNDSPGVVLKSKFVLPNVKTKGKARSFKDYVQYVDREEARGKEETPEEKSTKENYKNYHRYMEDERKSSGLFSNTKDHLSDEEREKVGLVFGQAQQKGSILWQDVISFRNDWLEEHGLYDAKTDTLNEAKLKNVTRTAMQEVKKREHTNETLWIGAIHRNTDNIHIHVASVEPTPERERGKRKPKTLDAVRSKVANSVMDRSKEQKKINNIIREDITHQLDGSKLFGNRKMKKQFENIMEQLPANKRYWQYGHGKLDPLRPEVDKLTKMYLQKKHGKDLKKLDKLLDKEVDVLKDTYGEKEREKYKDYKQNRMDDLYKRLGNATLKEMKEFAKEQEQADWKTGNGNRSNSNNGQRSSKWEETKKQFEQRKQEREAKQHAKQAGYAMKKLNRHLTNKYDSWKNEQEYERIHGMNKRPEYEGE